MAQLDSIILLMMQLLFGLYTYYTFKLSQHSTADTKMRIVDDASLSPAVDPTAVM